MPELSELLHDAVDRSVPLDLDRLRHRVARRRRRRRVSAVSAVAMAVMLAGAAGAVLITGNDDRRVEIIDRPPDGPAITRPAPPTTAAAAGRSRLVDIRVEAQYELERVIFEYSGGLPSPREVTVADAPAAEGCPEVPRVEGDAFLNVAISSYLPDGQLDEAVPRRVAGLPGGIVTEVAVACAAEGSVYAVIGLQGRQAPRLDRGLGWAANSLENVDDVEPLDRGLAVDILRTAQEIEDRTARLPVCAPDQVDFSAGGEGGGAGSIVIGVGASAPAGAEPCRLDTTATLALLDPETERPLDVEGNPVTITLSGARGGLDSIAPLVFWRGCIPGDFPEGVILEAVVDGYGTYRGMTRTPGWCDVIQTPGSRLSVSTTRG